MNKRTNQLRDYRAEAGEVKPPEQFRAYYFTLEATGCESIDGILAAVSRAARSYHHTQDWNDDDGTGLTPAQNIQLFAKAAAQRLNARIAALEAERDTALGRFNIFKAIVHNELDDLGIDKLGTYIPDSSERIVK